MDGARVWRVAMAALAVTTLLLGAALVLRPQPELEPAPAPPATTSLPNEGRSDRERRRASPPSVREDPDPAPPPRPPKDAARPEGPAPEGIEEFCRKELFKGGSVPAEAVVDRLLLDPERATEFMLESFTKRKEHGLRLAPHFYATFLAVAGDAAAVPMRAEWLATRETALMAALVRHGDAKTLRKLDEDHRKPHPRRTENPYLLVGLGEPARAMVWGWIEDPTVYKRVRDTAIAGMWVRGTDADRRRLWTEMDDTVRVVHFAPHMTRDANDWSSQLRNRVEAMLADSDPWVRVHGARAALQNRFEWGDALARRAATITAEYAELPAPEGRDAFIWTEMLRWIGIHRSQLPKEPSESEGDDAPRQE